MPTRALRGVPVGEGDVEAVTHDGFFPVSPGSEASAAAASADLAAEKPLSWGSLPSVAAERDARERETERETERERERGRGREMG